jgi:Cu(I)/Ag(I) efflux system periplasmic protein CusF
MKTTWTTLLSAAALSAWACISHAQSEMTAAEVRKIDLDSGKITLRHAEIKSLDMPAMTMVFAVKNRAQLAPLKAGDKVRFKAVKEAGVYTVVEIQPEP